MDRRALYQMVRDRDQVALKAKHIRQYDQEFAGLSGATPRMSVLEIGCGTGIFLRYLESKGYRRIAAVDTDEGLRSSLAGLGVADIHFGDVFAIAEAHWPGERFDRIALFDVIEHIEPDALFAFMERLGGLLAKDGRIVLRAPNVTSPWGVKMFFDTFDHVTPITPGRINELARMTGYEVLGIHEQVPGRWSKRLTQAMVHKLLEAALAYHPDIWSANLLAVLAPRDGAG